MADPIRVNGNMHSWGSIVVKFDGDSYTGFTSISYADKRERVKGYGMGRHHAPRGRSSGKYTVENPKLGGPTASCQALRAALAAKSADGVSYGNSEFLVVVQYVEYDEAPMHVEIDRCVLVGNSASHDESPDPLKEELELDAMAIRRNGLTLFDSTEGAPV